MRTDYNQAVFGEEYFKSFHYSHPRQSYLFPSLYGRDIAESRIVDDKLVIVLQSEDDNTDTLRQRLLWQWVYTEYPGAQAV